MLAVTKSASGIRILTMAWIGYWALLFIATHIPIDRRISERIPVGDLVIHAVAYSILAAIGGWRIVTSPHGQTTRRLLRWAGIYAAYGAIDEWLQPFTGRTASLADWLADLAGIVLGTCLAYVAHRVFSPSPRLSA